MQVLQDWTPGTGRFGSEANATVEYRIFRDGNAVHQELRTADGDAIGVFQLPEGIRCDRQSYEVMLRFALSQMNAGNP